MLLFRSRTKRIKRSNPKQDGESGEKSEQEKAAVAKAFTPKKVKAKKAAS